MILKHTLTIFTLYFCFSALVAAFSQPRSDLTATSVGNLIIFAGGRTTGNKLSNVVDIYDISSNSWTTSQLSEPRQWLSSTSVGTLAIFAGGLPPTQSPLSRTVDIFDASTKTWSSSVLSTGRDGIGATTFGGRYALFGGGYTADGTTIGRSSIVDVYDVYSKSWSNFYLSFATAAVAAASSSEHIYFAGGELSGSPGPYTDQIQVFDSNFQTTGRNLNNLAEPARPSAASVGQYILFFLGDKAPNQDSSAVTILDTVSNTRTVTSLSQARRAVGYATVGPLLLIGGGEQGTGRTKSAVVDIFDSRTGTWTSSRLSVARSRLAASGNGNIAIFAGGSENDAYGGSNEVISRVVDIYNYTSGQWTSFTSTQTPADIDAEELSVILPAVLCSIAGAVAIIITAVCVKKKVEQKKQDKEIALEMQAKNQQRLQISEHIPVVQSTTSLPLVTPPFQVQLQCFSCQVVFGLPDGVVAPKGAQVQCPHCSEINVI